MHTLCVGTKRERNRRKCFAKSARRSGLDGLDVATLAQGGHRCVIYALYSQTPNGWDLRKAAGSSCGRRKGCEGKKKINQASDQADAPEGGKNKLGGGGGGKKIKLAVMWANGHPGEN